LFYLLGGVYGGVMGGQPAMQYGAGGEVKQTIDVPKSVVGKIIGKGGETITLVQRKSGAKVTVDQSVPEGQPCKVSLSIHSLYSEGNGN
jgi:far upstream element-binding protein